MPEYTDEIVIKYYNKKYKFRVNYSDIRKELDELGYDKKTITKIMNRIDNLSVKKELLQNIKRRYISIFSTGILLSSVGFFLATCSIFDLCNTNIKFYYTLMPLFSGILLSLQGRVMHKQYIKDKKL